MFKEAIVRKPCKNIVNGLSNASLGKPDFDKTLMQHSIYVDVLKQCGLEVTVLEADENYPDSTFVEDTALIIPNCAIITNPGAESRKGEIVEIKKIAKEIFPKVEYIRSPGTVDAGDILMVESHFYIGISERTNINGANQIIEILEKYGNTGSGIKLEDVLHLKSGVAYLENNTLVVSGEFINNSEFRKYNRIIIENDESYAANCLWINGKVLIAKGFPGTKNMIEEAGYETIEIDVSEFRKIDGGLSCLSLRF